jgi:hypothetical protein
MWASLPPQARRFVTLSPVRVLVRQALSEAHGLQRPVRLARSSRPKDLTMPQRNESSSSDRPTPRPRTSATRTPDQRGEWPRSSAPSWDERTYRGGAFGYGGWNENFAQSAPADRTGSPSQGDEPQPRPRRSYRGIGPQGYTRSDERIKEDVSEELSDDPDVDASRILVTVKDAEVTLTGTVPEQSMRAFAEQAASRAVGVRIVHNQLSLLPHPEQR